MNKDETVLYQPDDISAASVRLKFNALSSPRVSSFDVRNIQHGQGYIRRVIDWLNQKDVLGEYHNADKGWDIAFNNRSVRNVLNHDAGEGKVALLEYAPYLIENGVYITTTIKGGDGKYAEATPAEINNTLISKSHIFAAKATIDGQNHTIGVVVREDSNGKRYYDHVIRIGDSAEPRLRKSETASAILPEPLSTISNIVQKHLVVNNQN